MKKQSRGKYVCLLLYVTFLIQFNNIFIYPFENYLLIELDILIFVLYVICMKLITIHGSGYIWS